VNEVDEGVEGSREGVMREELFPVSAKRPERIAGDKFDRAKYISNEDLRGLDIRFVRPERGTT
jgi:hypothetical protein